MQNINYFIDNKGLCPSCKNQMALIGCVNFYCKENKKRRKDLEFNIMMQRFKLLLRKNKINNQLVADTKWIGINNKFKNLDNTHKKTYNNSV